MNNKRKKVQKVPISCASQKISIKKEKYLTFKALKSHKIISISYINAKNKQIG